ncbi:MAG: CxxxxCH/CxxCH domain-containing protein, partial [Deltaproteobacteria bacterium]
GTTLPAGGGSNTTPNWTRADGSQAACGTCHGLPPGGTHPVSTRCEVCHSTVMGAGGTFINPALHINGVVDVTTASCESCHGGGGSAAPPTGVGGETATTARAVGAHRAHLTTPSTWHAPVTCAECHVVPTRSTSPGHLDTPLPAEVTWGALATTDTATPSWSGTTCSGTYCHGATLVAGAGTNTAPTWTVVDGTQDACGTCHGLPPGGTHYALTRCEACHSASMGPGRTFANPALHIDGIVQWNTAHSPGWTGVPGNAPHGRAVNATGYTSCQECHGVNLDGGGSRVSCNSCHSGWQTNCVFCHGGRDNTTGAPPFGLLDQTVRTALPVGAHSLHVQQTTIHAAWDCVRCHVKPTSVTSPGHIDGDGRAEQIFDALNPASVYNLTTGVCSNNYCHSRGLATANVLGTMTWNTDPVITCTSCHGATTATAATMSGQHRRHIGASVACYRCHSTVASTTGTILASGLALHVDGIRQVTFSGTGTINRTGRITCAPSCHGSQPWY